MQQTCFQRAPLSRSAENSSRHSDETQVAAKTSSAVRKQIACVSTKSSMLKMPLCLIPLHFERLGLRTCPDCRWMDPKKGVERIDVGGTIVTRAQRSKDPNPSASSSSHHQPLCRARLLSLLSLSSCSLIATAVFLNNNNMARISRGSDAENIGQ